MAAPSVPSFRAALHGQILAHLASERISPPLIQRLRAELAISRGGADDEEVSFGFCKDEESELMRGFFRGEVKCPQLEGRVEFLESELTRLCGELAEAWGRAEEAEQVVASAGAGCGGVPGGDGGGHPGAPGGPGGGKPGACMGDHGHAAAGHCGRWRSEADVEELAAKCRHELEVVEKQAVGEVHEARRLAQDAMSALREGEWRDNDLAVELSRLRCEAVQCERREGAMCQELAAAREELAEVHSEEAERRRDEAAGDRDEQREGTCPELRLGTCDLSSAPVRGNGDDGGISFGTPSPWREADFLRDELAEARSCAARMQSELEAQDNELRAQDAELGSLRRKGHAQQQEDTLRQQQPRSCNRCELLQAELEAASRALRDEREVTGEMLRRGDKVDGGMCTTPSSRASCGSANSGGGSGAWTYQDLATPSTPSSMRRARSAPRQRYTADRFTPPRRWPGDGAGCSAIFAADKAAAAAAAAAAMAAAVSGESKREEGAGAPCPASPSKMPPPPTPPPRLAPTPRRRLSEQHNGCRRGASNGRTASQVDPVFKDIVRRSFAPSVWRPSASKHGTPSPYGVGGRRSGLQHAMTPPPLPGSLPVEAMSRQQSHVPRPQHGHVAATAAAAVAAATAAANGGWQHVTQTGTWRDSGKVPYR
eukprot:TRINITY_DN19457_c0_g2_i1.p1 TRINITY_DN19457_c0_g2~~TRINITY_DN19457_c0_g2_i1.p1  ORF type:complete len:688 (-),score=153.68 TRINITY_DN19457_c0_g2_i1:69-2036(-)